MKNISEFLSYIGGNENKIIKVYKHNNSINRKTMVKIHESQIEKENKSGDIYYVVNSGSDKNDGITNFNSVFIDFDAGKDEDNNYYSLEQVQDYKTSFINKVNNYKIKPTFIIKTRNGYHVYWVLKDNTSLDKWNTCMNKLINKFNSDKQVNNPARLMRLPFTYWMKDRNNPYYVDIVEFNDVKYDIDYLLDSLADVKFENRKGGHDKKVSNNTLIYHDHKNPLNKILIQYGKIEELQMILKPMPKTFVNQNDFYNYITQEIDLTTFLGVSGEKFQCIFHDDGNPSAGIFISNRNQYFYKCHSSSCGFMGNIIGCVERLRKCNRPQAINFIKEVFKLTIEETDWQKEQKLILEENKRMIREGEMEEFYPEIYKLIKNYKDLIYLLHDIAIDNVFDEKYSDNENNVVFFASISKLQEGLNLSNRKRIADRNALFAFLYLLNKLKEDDVPEKYLTKAKHIAAKNNQKSIVNFYSIPSYCDEILQKSIKRAIEYKENNLSMKGWSRELLLRTFGEEIANEIYPQFTHRKATKQSNERTIEIHKVVLDLLNKNKFVTEKEVVEMLHEDYGKTQTQIQIKKSLQEMLDTYGLVRIRCNNKIKETYGVVSNGYPFIIVKGSNTDER